MKCGHCKEEGVDLAHVKACAGGITHAMTNHPSQATVTVTLPTPDVEIQLPETVVTVTTLRFVEEGYYTVVFDEERDDRITLRVRPHWEEQEAAKGNMVVDYLAGSDNTKDYVGFAFLTPHAPRSMWSVWKRYRENTRLARALEVLHRDPESAGMEYAIRSGNCRKCGRTLTVPASIHRGMGPVCAKGGRD